ncbi:MAG: radical SAM protein [Pirellulaceae bacterium]|nr:radical SAM protein [Pirellulaceae bacterium]
MLIDRLRVVVLKPSKYTELGFVERFRRGFMPNSTVPYIRSMTPAFVGNTPVEVHSIDEYVHCDLDYLSLLRRERGGQTLLALVGVQSHQFQRALDLAAFSKSNGCSVVIGGPHVMTCDTSMLHGRGVSFAQSEAELVWSEILNDAVTGELQPLYGQDRRWQQELKSPVLAPPNRTDLGRYIMPMLGVYPARGCPFLCNFCSVTKIAGRKIRSQSIDTTMASLRTAKAAGVRTIMFTSDNFNKYPEASELLKAMVDEQLGMKFFVQCDTQIARQDQLVELLGKAGCFQMFVGAESFDRQTLLAAHKGQNRPETYREIVRLCREHSIGSHFSNIIGFPQDTEQKIHEHLAILRELDPSWASFYILCPIPGTEQYDDFLTQGLITEKNLDRFDTTSLTWRHPSLSRDQLAKLLFESYRKFFSMRHSLDTARAHCFRNGRLQVADTLGSLAMSLFVRYSVWQHTHPMSGGVARVHLDQVKEYMPLRKETFGFELVPLPKSLPLPVAEKLLNKELGPRITTSNTHLGSTSSSQSKQASIAANSNR